MTGHEALGQCGRWQETAEYGAVWFPQGVPVGRSGTPPQFPTRPADIRRPLKSDHPWTEMAPTSKQNVGVPHLAPVSAIYPRHSSQAQVAAGLSAPSGRIDSTEIDTAHVMPEHRSRKPEAVAVVPGSVPLVQPRFETGHAAPPRLEPRRHDPVMDKQCESDRCGPGPSKRRQPDR